MFERKPRSPAPAIAPAGVIRPVLVALLVLVSGDAAPWPGKQCLLPGTSGTALCGSVDVALDPSDEKAGRLSIGFAWVPAMGTRAHQPPLLLLTDGSPESLALGSAGNLLSQIGVLAGRALLVVDPRGSGRSAPLTCGAAHDRTSGGTQLDPAQQLVAERACVAELKDRANGQLRFYTSAQVANDVEAIRTIAGIEQFDVVAYGLASWAALDYANRYAVRVRRLAMVSPDWSGSAVSHANWFAANRALLQVFARCKADLRCDAAYPRLRARWQALLESTEQPSAVTLPDPITRRPLVLRVDREALLSMVWEALKSPAALALMPHAIAEASAGRFGALAALPSRSPSRVEAARRVRQCAALGSRIDLDLTRRIGGDFATLVQSHQRACGPWEQRSGHITLSSLAQPVLILASASDPANPLESSRRAKTTLGPDARLRVVEADGRLSFADPCVWSAVKEFLEAGAEMRPNSPAGRQETSFERGCGLREMRRPLYVAPKTGWVQKASLR